MSKYSDPAIIEIQSTEIDIVNDEKHVSKLNQLQSQRHDSLASFPKTISLHSSVASFLDRQKARASRWSGLLLAAVSGILLTLYSSIYKIVKTEIDNSTVLMLRSLIQISVMVLILAYQRKNVMPKNMQNYSRWKKVKVWLTFIFVCVFGGLRLCFIFAALEKIPMALVHTILNGSPVVVMILGHFFLKDPCNILRTFCTFGLAGGVILIFQPQTLIGIHTGSMIPSLSNSSDIGVSNTSNVICIFNSTKGSDDCPGDTLIEEVEEDLVGYAFSIGALILSAFGSVLTKKITQNFDKMVIALYLGFSIGLVGWMQLMIFEPKAPVIPSDHYPWIMATIVGLLGVAQQFCLIAALKLESPTRVTVVRSLQIVISFIVQIQAWSEHPGVDQIIGAMIVLAAICTVTMENQINQKCETSHLKPNQLQCCQKEKEIVEKMSEEKC